jgi:hypothetical protein
LWISFLPFVSRFCSCFLPAIPYLLSVTVLFVLGLAFRVLRPLDSLTQYTRFKEVLT